MEQGELSGRPWRGSTARNGKALASTGKGTVGDVTIPVGANPRSDIS